MTNSPGRPMKPVVLSKEDERELKRIVRRPSSSSQSVSRARMILLAARGWPNNKISDEVGVCAHTVGKWRQRFLAFGLVGLGDLPRPKEPMRTSDADVARLIRKTLQATPKGATHWSTRLMAKQSGLSQSTVSRIWRTFKLKPHRSETFSLSTDPEFVAKVRDIVGLYLAPPSRAVVLCVDEKSQIQALERTQLVLPMRPGTPERSTPTYLRHGTTTLFAALDIITGQVIGECHRRHRSTEFLKFLKTINKQVPAELDVHLVLDNYATHGTEAVLRWRRRHPRFHFHFTPTYSSWLNQVERWFALLTERAIKRAAHRSTRALERDIRAFLDAHNEDPKPFIWTKSADQILGSIARTCQLNLELRDMQRIVDSAH